MFNKMIRIFISSTFINFIEERNSLVAVFKELSMFCKSAGFSFQVLDLRWGISDEDSHDNRTLQICLDEIARCQMLSPKPNFLIMSGLYYGWIPLPPCIAKDIWDKIADEVPVSSLLRRWYLQDTNDAKCPYILRPRIDKECNPDEWKKIEDILKNELFPLIYKHFSDKNKHYDIWGLSATELEIYKGLFCCPENRNHVFVLMRKNEPESCSNLEPKNMQVRAVALQEHLKDAMGTFADTNILSYQLGDNYTEKTKNFLKQIIQFRIDEVLAEEEALPLFQREKQLIDEAVRQSEKDYMDCSDNQDDFLKFCQNNCGKIILMTGKSGSGKSTLLKHCYHISREYFVLSCADILPSCSRISHALWFCLKQLEEKGMLSTPDIEPDTEQCTIWFEKQLKRFNSNTPVTILLDSVDQICDWNQIGGSLLECRLPKNLTLVISCISKDSLNKRDCKKHVPSYSLQPLTSQDAIRLLEQLLHNRRRLLCEEDKRYIFSKLPQSPTPLYIQLLCQQLQKRHSFDLRPLELPIGTKESIYIQLKSQSKNYPGLYYHTIGYLALAVDGLSEQELLALLERDAFVIKEVNELSHWKTKQKGFPLSVLWARIFYELKDYLSEVDSNGILLLRFHHDLVRKTAMEMVRKNLIHFSHIMSSYFQEEPTYLNKTKDMVIVNTRKLRELFPAFAFQNNWQAASNLLADPEYTDGYLRCGWYRDLMLQFMELGQRKYLNTIHKKLLSLLQRKAMQFQLWGDSFLPAATEFGLYPTKNMIGLGWQYLLQYKALATKHEKNLQDKLPLPNATNARIGIKEDGTLAIIDGKVLKRYDLTLQSEIYPRCYIDVTNAFLYWKGNLLFVRDNSSRITFYDTGRELVQEKVEKAPSLVDLYSDNINKVIRAGGFDERDSEGYHSNTIFQYQSGGMLKNTELFYSNIENIRCFCHGILCAVIINQRKLEIIDLDQRLLLASYLTPNACFVYWNPQGTEILVVLERDKILRFPCNYKNPQPLAGPSTSIEKHAKAYRQYIGRKEVLKIFQFSCPVNRQDTPAYIDSVLGSQQPMYAAFSIYGDRLACYYYYLNEGVIRLFQLSNRELLAQSTVDPIFWNDSVGRPIYFSADGSALILTSRGKQHIWDMDSLKWNHHTKYAASYQTEFAHSLQQKYASCMNPWLPSKDYSVAKSKNLLLHIIRKTALLLLSPLIRSSQINKDNVMLLHKRIQQIPILESDGFWWILDCYHSMIHVCDKDGKWLCHEQLSEEIFDFNVIDHNVYVLPIDLSEPIQLLLSPIDTLSIQIKNIENLKSNIIK